MLSQGDSAISVPVKVGRRRARRTAGGARVRCPGGRKVASGAMPTLVVLRHGESTWNAENRFTGWTDVDSERGGRGRGA